MAITLKAARINAGLKQSEVADKMEVSPSTMVSWETGKTSPTARQFVLLCKLYGCGMDDIFLPEKSN